MTAILGLVHDGKVYIGGDSANSNHIVNIIDRKKVFVQRPSNLLIGITGSTRYAQIVEHHINIDPCLALNFHSYLVTMFIPALREALKTHGFTKTESGQESADYGAMLVGHKHYLVRIESDFSVQPYVRGFDAIGSANSLAIGAMAALSPRLAPEKRITRALEISAEFDPYVRPPFVIRNTGELS